MGNWLYGVFTKFTDAGGNPADERYNLVDLERITEASINTNGISLAIQRKVDKKDFDKLAKVLAGSSKKMKHTSTNVISEHRKLVHNERTLEAGRAILDELGETGLVGTEFEKAAFEWKQQFRPNCEYYDGAYPKAFFVTGELRRAPCSSRNHHGCIGSALCALTFDHCPSTLAALVQVMTWGRRVRAGKYIQDLTKYKGIDVPNNFFVAFEKHHGKEKIDRTPSTKSTFVPIYAALILKLRPELMKALQEKSILLTDVLPKGPDAKFLVVIVNNLSDCAGASSEVGNDKHGFALLNHPDGPKVTCSENTDITEYD